MEDSEEFSDEAIESAKARWRSAESMSELCELGAGFLEGAVPFFPGYLSPSPADETDPLIDELARLNRKGFLTVGSQPGFDGDGFDGKNWKQRAFVQGFAQEPIATQLTEVTLLSDVVAYAAKDSVAARWMSIPAVQRGGEPVLWIGRPVGLDELFFHEACNEIALDVLESAYYVCLFDPKWGRKNHLWQRIRAVI